MSFFQPNMLPLLYQQHAQYSAELAQTHQALGKLYKKLAKVERVLAQREEKELSRSDRKKWQYTRTLSRRGIANLESEQAGLQVKLQQCCGLIATYEHSAVYTSPMTPWTAQMPPSPYMFTPFSPVAYPPWTSHTSQPSSDGQSETRPQYWDLSMLRERRLSSPYGSSADSGYHEPLIHGLSNTNDPFNATNHVYVHEMLQPMFDTTLAGSTALGNIEGKTTPSSENEDKVPALLKTPVSPAARLGAQLHKRCYSMDAAQLVKAPSTQKHVRGSSVGPAASSKVEEKEQRIEVEQTSRTRKAWHS